MKKIFTKIRVVGFICFVLGVITGVLLMTDVPEKWILDRAREYATEYTETPEDNLTDARLRETVRVDFNGGLQKGGIEVDMEKKTGRMLSVRH